MDFTKFQQTHQFQDWQKANSEQRYGQWLMTELAIENDSYHTSIAQSIADCYYNDDSATITEFWNTLASMANSSKVSSR